MAVMNGANVRMVPDDCASRMQQADTVTPHLPGSYDEEPQVPQREGPSRSWNANPAEKGMAGQVALSRYDCDVMPVGEEPANKFGELPFHSPDSTDTVRHDRYAKWCL